MAVSLFFKLTNITFAFCRMFEMAYNNVLLAARGSQAKLSYLGLCQHLAKHINH